jgi:hypothetical protein
MYDSVGFGKHAKHTLPQIALMDPDHFFWLCEESRALHANRRLLHQARRVYERARNIRPPEQFGPRGTAVLYRVYSNGRFGGIELVPATGHRPQDPPGSFVQNSIDLYASRRMKHYDKLGSRILVMQALRLRGLAGARLTRRFCEDFFDNDDHFLFEDGPEEEAASA